MACSPNMETRVCIVCISGPPSTNRTNTPTNMGGSIKTWLSNFILGLLSRSWREGIGFYSSDDPSGHEAQLLTLIWDGLCEPIWACRNDIIGLTILIPRTYSRCQISEPNLNGTRGSRTKSSHIGYAF
jgi:hypothetical protein